MVPIVYLNFNKKSGVFPLLQKHTNQVKGSSAVCYMLCLIGRHKVFVSETERLHNLQPLVFNIM